MKSDDKPKRLLKVAAAAHYLSISPWSVRKLVQSQQLRVVQMDDRGPWLLDITELDRFIEARKRFV